MNYLTEQPGVLQVVPSQTLKLHSGPGGMSVWKTNPRRCISCWLSSWCAVLLVYKLNCLLYFRGIGSIINCHIRILLVTCYNSLRMRLCYLFIKSSCLAWNWWVCLILVALKVEICHTFHLNLNVSSANKGSDVWACSQFDIFFFGWMLIITSLLITTSHSVLNCFVF